MSPMKVIGASMGRSGTDSMRVALDILGYKAHHMKCFFEDSNLSSEAFYKAYLDQENADWDDLYKDYDAAVDWTGSTFYKSLLSRYPDAKVLLTLRSPDSWYNSIRNTMSKTATEESAISPESPYYSLRRLSIAVCLDGQILDPKRVATEEHMKKLYLEHIEEVKRVVPPDQLLIMELGEGWDRMCKFLGKDVPNVPYPKVNTTADFERYFINQEWPKNIRVEKVSV